MSPPDLPSLPPREKDTHKGTYGRLLLFCGSEGMPGAAILAARAAYRGGAGLVTVCVPRRLFSTISPAVPEAIFLEREAWTDGSYLPESFHGFSAVLIGPGLGAEASPPLVRMFLEHCRCPVILDADALNSLAQVIEQAEWFPPPRADIIWTPHPGEFERLTWERPRGDAARLEAARKWAQARDGVLVLKGHRTLVLSRERHAVNETGNPGMATAGSGDVLGGIIAAFLGQGLPPFDAARLAVHLHGRAGDLAAEELGEVSLVASDLIEFLPRAIQERRPPEGLKDPRN